MSVEDTWKFQAVQRGSVQQAARHAAAVVCALCSASGACSANPERLKDAYSLALHAAGAAAGREPAASPPEREAAAAATIATTTESAAQRRSKIDMCAQGLPVCTAAVDATRALRPNSAVGPLRGCGRRRILCVRKRWEDG